jgi:SET domain-containing protein
MSQRQIEDLNMRVKTKLSPSPLHGIGVFAVRNIKAGDKLYADQLPRIYNLKHSNFNKLFEAVRTLLLERWPQIINGSAFVYPDARMQAYMNHSDDPNYDASTDLALKDIAVGEEILENYRKIPNYEKIYTFLTVEK